MTRRAPLPPHVQGSAFLVGDAEFHAATPGRLRASDVQRPFTGVRSIGLDLGDLIDRCRAYEPLLRPGEAFSNSTAAELCGLPLPETASALHVVAPPGLTPARTRGVIGHRSGRPFSAVHRHGLPVADVALVWCQLGSYLSKEDLVAVGDAVVTGRRSRSKRAPGLATIEQLSFAVRDWAGGRGARNLRWALPRVRVGAESRPETLTRLLLVAAGLPEPLLNVPTLIDGRRVLHPDLTYPRWRIALEYEGDGHRTDRRRWQADIRRHRALESAGWRVIRVTADDLFADPAGLVARVHDRITLVEARMRSRA